MDSVGAPMNAEIRQPGTRMCTQCGREERWDTEDRAWRVAEEEAGEVFCIHDWDITGEFTPVRR